MSKRSVIVLHLVFWTFKIGVEFVMYQLPNINSEPLIYFWRGFAVTWLGFGAYFYLNYSWLIPAFLLKGRILAYAIMVLFSTFLLFELLSVNWNHFDLKFLVPHKEFIPLIAFGCGIHYFASTALKLLDYWIESEKLKRKLLKEVKETELLFLKSQMSPHFLFNTLNNIYGLAINNSPLTTLAISHLKEMMLYVQNFKDGQRISIHLEAEYLKSFIALNQLRYGCKVVFDQEIKSEMLIEPMILLPFIENAFKHGDTRPSSEIRLNLKCLDEKLVFQIVNKIDVLKRKDHTGGIGIENVKRRLTLIYGNKLGLFLQEDDQTYLVNLTLDRI